MEIPGYQIDKKVGKGGMATVYLATQVSLSRHVVLKVLDISQHTDNTAQIERFLAEGRIVASLNHPNIITIYDIGIADDNSLYISMEYIKGGDLKSRMGIPMDPHEAIDYLIQIGSGLKVAHEHEIIHRDVKPANILFRENNIPLLTDFGIAKQLGNDLNLTSTGIFLGSPNYVSPEQATGEEIDGRSDIYSLGCIFFEMLTGEKPYKADTVFDVVMQHKNSPVPELPGDLKIYQTLLARMMAKNRHERFESAGAMIEFMRNLVNEQKTAITYDFSSMINTGDKKNSKTIKILLIMLVVSAIFFGSLQYVDIRLKSGAVNLSEITIETTLGEQTEIIPSTNNITAGNSTLSEPVSDDVINALTWLGNQSLEEFRLTYPPKDNAYYYFTRLLQLNPDNPVARKGMLEIADRYAVLAERSLANNEYAKTEAYIQLGLKINPRNQTLLSLKRLNEQTRKTSFLDTIKNLFK
jgi:serine/threonine-protein kinase PpkA